MLTIVHISDLHFGPFYLPAIGEALLRIAPTSHDMVQHSELPWHYGVLDKVIASPRFHRLHHSTDPRDYNLHYANIFSFWDYVFGTVSARYRGDTSVASDCEIGLGNCPEAERLNSGLRNVLHETIPAKVWAFALSRGFGQAKSAE